jgi:GntR family transcriptional repressor for pyruvate dehydrogenase complex
MVLAPVVRTSLVEEVAGRLRALVSGGRLQAGDRLPSEPELVGQLGVSRTVLREAIGRLETMGLLTVSRGRGTFVADRGGLASCVKLVGSAIAISPKDLAQLSEFRALIECHCARRAAERATPEDLAELAAICAAMDRRGQDHLEAIRLDMRFHLKIVSIAGNDLMRHALEVMQEYVTAGMVRTTDAPRDRALSRRVHRAILKAVRSRNPDRAERAMRAHMDHLLRRVAERAGEGPP